MPAHEDWLSKQQVMAITGWSPRHIERKDAAGELRTRETGEMAGNGKPIKQYAATSLNPDHQVDLLKLRTRESALAVVSQSAHPIVKLPEGPTAIQRVALTPAQEAQADRRYEIITPLIRFANSTNGSKPVFVTPAGSRLTSLSAVVSYVAGVHKCGERTIWNWWKAYSKQGYGDLAKATRRDQGKSRYFEQHPDLAAFVEGKFLSQRERLSISLIYDAVLREFPRFKLNEQDAPPDYKTLRVFLKRSISNAVVIAAREGERVFNEQCAPFIIRNIAAIRCNQVWISDHMFHDVFCRNYDSATGTAFFGELPLNAAFRPVLTCIVDMRSRKVMGTAWCVNPSSESISSALRMAMTRYGLPKVFYVDNGKDYLKVARGPVPRISKEAGAVLLRNKVEAHEYWQDIEQQAEGGVLYRLGVESQHCLPLHPQSKQIESFFKTLHRRFDVLCGPIYSGPSPKERPEACERALSLHARLLKEDRADESLLPPASEFFQAAHAWMEISFNAEHRHSGNGMRGKSPDAIYNIDLPASKRNPVDPFAVAELFWDRKRRTVREGGTVEINNARYEPADADSFAALANEIKREILIACDPLNVGEAIALDLTGRPIARLKAQELLVHGATDQATLRAEMRKKRLFWKAAKGYVQLVNRSREIAGDQSELEVLARRAAASASTPNIHRALPVLRALNGGSAAALGSEPRLHVDDIVDRILEED